MLIFILERQGSMTKVVSIISGKGGTGKSTICAALSKELAGMGKSVLAVDMDIGLRSLDLLFSLESKVTFDLGDVISGRCDYKAAIVNDTANKKLSLLCSPRTVTKDFSALKLLSVLKQVIEESAYDYVMLDLPAGIGFSVLVAKELSTDCVAVTQIDPVALRDTATLVRAISGFEKLQSIRLILNRISIPTLVQSGLADLDEAIDKVGARLLGVLPEDPWICSKIPHKKTKPDTQKIINTIALRLEGHDISLLFKDL